MLRTSGALSGSSKELLQIHKSRKRQASGGKMGSSLPTRNTSHIVPWASHSEWEHVCTQFNREEWKAFQSEIKLWKCRIPTLPVGVESTVLLIQALLYDADTTRVISNDELRSLYSLAVIRFLNHISHLATKEMGGASTLPMFKLASHVSVPEWIVNLRHEASHGTSLPHLEVLRYAASFIKDWFKENYWVPREKAPSISTCVLTPKKTILTIDDSKSTEATISQKIRQIISAFIATRIYKLRQCSSISDPEILNLLSNQNVNRMKTKSAIVLLKKKIVNFLSSESVLTCTVLAQEMIPRAEFYHEFSTIFQNLDAFEQLCLVLNPIIKLIQKKGKLVSVCLKLAEIQVMENAIDNSLHMCALWLDKLLNTIQMQSNEPSSFNELNALLLTVIKSPNGYTNIYIDRLFQLVEEKVGPDNIRKLRTLVSVWVNDSTNYNSSKYKKMKGARSKGVLFTYEDIVQSPNKEMAQKDNRICTNSSVVTSHYDQRGSKFWRHIPLGASFPLNYPSTLMSRENI